MSKAKPVHVYPVEGRYLLDVPHVEHDCTDPRCVESGAFTVDPPKKADPEPAAAAADTEE
jgi:hypothetical protein